MILELRNKTPFIHFGFNRVNKVDYLNVPIKVYLNTLYNENDYSFKLVVTGGTFVKVSNYEYDVTFNSLGSQIVGFEILNLITSKVTNSNVLNIEVQSITVDNTRITVDNDIITVDNN